MNPVKSAKQVKGIRKACQLTAEAVRLGGSLVKEGVSTGYIDQGIDEFIRSKGGFPASLGYRGFPKATCISVNEEACHGIPSYSKILKNNDIVKIDVAVILNGFFGDCCETYVVNGDHEILRVNRTALDFGIAEVKAGRQICEIGRGIEDYVKTTSYSIVTDMCGHGVGLRFHEPPQILHYFEESVFGSSEGMRENMIFTIEPILSAGSGEIVTCPIDKWTIRTEDNSITSQFEHTILVTKKGFEILTL